MKIRELLQTEIWSNRTSRKILVWLGIVCCSIVVCLYSWREVELHWLTSGERVAAKDALREIDALQDASSLSDQEFKERSKQAEAKVKLAGATAITYRDNFIQMKLGFYLVGVELDRRSIRTGGPVHEQAPQQEQSTKEHEAVISTLQDLKHQSRSDLHKALD
jgi:hypothetical protein